MNEERNSDLSHEAIIIIRPSFKKFCGADACRAALFNQFLYRIAGKAEDQDQSKVKRGEISWYGSAKYICDKELDNSWSINKVIKETKALIAAGLVGQRHNPVKKWDQTMHYFIGEEQGKIIREHCKKYDICLAHLGLPPAVLHLLYLVNAYDKFGKCNCQIQQIDLPNTADRFTKFGNAIPKESYKETTKETYQERKSSDPLQAKEISLSPSAPTNIIFSLEEQRILKWYCELEPTPINKALAQKHCAVLADSTKTYEQFQRLHAIAAIKIHGDDKTVHLGNMVNALTAWRKEQQQATDQWWNQSQQSEQAVSPPILESSLPPKEEVSVDWEQAELSSETRDWMIQTSLDWHDEPNAPVNVEILQVIYQSAQRSDEEFYGILIAVIREVYTVPENERMDRFFLALCSWLGVEVPYEPVQPAAPMEVAV